MTPAKTYSHSWMPDVFGNFFDTEWMPKANATAPSINVIDNEHDYEVELAAPGLTKDDFHIHINKDGELVINMEKKERSEEHDRKNRKYLRREFSYTKFEQSLILPDNVDRKHIGAAVKDGVLTITLPKLDEQAAEVKHMIEVK